MSKAYYLIQSTVDVNNYKVDKLVNALEPLAGSTLKKSEVEDLIAIAIRKGDKVHITRAPARK